MPTVAQKHWDFEKKNEIFNVRKKNLKKGKTMNAVSSRLDEDLRAPLSQFLDNTGIRQATVINACIRAFLPILEDRRKKGEPIFGQRVKRDSSEDCQSEP